MSTRRVFASMLAICKAQYIIIGGGKNKEKNSEKQRQPRSKQIASEK